MVPSYLFKGDFYVVSYCIVSIELGTQDVRKYFADLDEATSFYHTISVNHPDLISIDLLSLKNVVLDFNNLHGKELI